MSPDAHVHCCEAVTEGVNRKEGSIPSTRSISDLQRLKCQDCSEDANSRTNPRTHPTNSLPFCDGKRREHIPVKLTIRPFNVAESSVVMNLANYPRFSRSTKRRWIPVEQSPSQQSASPSEENLQMDLPFMTDHPREVAANGDFPQSGSKEGNSGWKTSNFFNVPPRRGDAGLTALPSNPMKDQL